MIPKYENQNGMEIVILREIFIAIRMVPAPSHALHLLQYFRTRYKII